MFYLYETFIFINPVRHHPTCSENVKKNSNKINSYIKLITSILVTVWVMRRYVLPYVGVQSLIVVQLQLLSNLSDLGNFI